jgi:hypothetical protein
LRVRFLEICRLGRVRAEGRKIRYCGIQTEGRISVTRVIETTFQIIPAEDWADHELYDSGDGLRLEASREFFEPDLVFELRGWAFVRFSVADLRALTRALIEDALGKVVSTGTVVRRPPAEKPFWDKARVEARKWLDEEGFPEPGDGGQAKLEKHIEHWLGLRGHKAVQSTIRSHVGRWIQEFRNNL